MPEPGSPEWKARRAQILTDELSQPLRWFYLSYADDDGFRGALILEAHGEMHAIELAQRLGLSPGGQVVVWEVPEDVAATLPAAAKGRLLSKPDLERLFGEKTVQ
jgi:hypothetical protein